MLATVSVGNSFQQALNSFFGYLPNILGFVVLVAIGYIVARVVRTVINKVTTHFRIDQHLTSSRAGAVVERVSPGGRPSRFVGAVVFWLIFIFFLTAAIGALKIPSVTDSMNRVLAYLPNVIAAVIIFVIAAALSGIIAAAAVKVMGDTPTGKLAGTILPGLIMAIAIFMVLNQLKIATEIVTITYAALLGMLALTGALAFGLGGRDVAGQIWAQTYQKSQDAQAQARADLQTGKTRAQAQLSDGISDPGPAPTPPGARSIRQDRPLEDR